MFLYLLKLQNWLKETPMFCSLQQTTVSVRVLANVVQSSYENQNFWRQLFNNIFHAPRSSSKLSNFLHSLNCWTISKRKKIFLLQWFFPSSIIVMVIFVNNCTTSVFLFFPELDNLTTRVAVARVIR